MPPRARSTERSRKQLPGFFGRNANVYLYVPNLIGYLRVAFALYAFSVSRVNPARCFAFYLASFVCDELDGRFARMLDQTSTLGAVLDMVTDRVATSCLLAVLCTLYPSWQPIFLALLMLDIFSHWFQMYATLAMGKASHKDVTSHSMVVRFYYQHRLFMGFCCCCVEALYLFSYLLAFKEFHNWTAPIALPEGTRNLLASWGVQTPRGAVPVLWLLAASTVPGFCIKQMVNVVQLRTAAGQLVQYDLKQQKRRRPKST